jgi:hypothetical protein
VNRNQQQRSTERRRRRKLANQAGGTILDTSAAPDGTRLGTSADTRGLDRTLSVKSDAN